MHVPYEIFVWVCLNTWHTCISAYVTFASLWQYIHSFLVFKCMYDVWMRLKFICVCTCWTYIYTSDFVSVCMAIVFMFVYTWMWICGMCTLTWFYVPTCGWVYTLMYTGIAYHIHMHFLTHTFLSGVCHTQIGCVCICVGTGVWLLPVLKF